MPSKKSVKWIVVFIIYFIITIAALLLSRIILKSNLLFGYIINIIILALVSSLIPCIGGFLGRKAFFITYTISAVASIIYLYYIVLHDRSSGWGDLTSIIGYLFILGIGTIAALVAETIMLLVRLKQKYKSKS